MMEDDIRSKVILPCIECNVYDLPDSDGMSIATCIDLYGIKIVN